MNGLDPRPARAFAAFVAESRILPRAEAMAAARARMLAEVALLPPLPPTPPTSGGSGGGIRPWHVGPLAKPLLAIAIIVGGALGVIVDGHHGRSPKAPSVALGPPSRSQSGVPTTEATTSPPSTPTGTVALPVPEGLVSSSPVGGEADGPGALMPPTAAASQSGTATTVITSTSATTTAASTATTVVSSSSATTTTTTSGRGLDLAVCIPPGGLGLPTPSPLPMCVEIVLPLPVPIPLDLGASSGVLRSLLGWEQHGGRATN